MIYMLFALKTRKWRCYILKKLLRLCTTLYATFSTIN